MKTSNLLNTIVYDAYWGVLILCLFGLLFTLRLSFATAVSASSDSSDSSTSVCNYHTEITFYQKRIHDLQQQAEHIENLSCQQKDLLAYKYGYMQGNHQNASLGYQGQCQSLIQLNQQLAANGRILRLLLLQQNQCNAIKQQQKHTASTSSSHQSLSIENVDHEGAL